MTDAEAKAMKAEIKRLRGALDVFARIYRLNEPIAASWPDDMPARDFIPGVWPVWKDFKAANAAISREGR